MCGLRTGRQLLAADFPMAEMADLARRWPISRRDGRALWQARLLRQHRRQLEQEALGGHCKAPRAAVGDERVQRPAPPPSTEPSEEALPTSGRRAAFEHPSATVLTVPSCAACSKRRRRRFDHGESTGRAFEPTARLKKAAGWPRVPACVSARPLSSAGSLPHARHEHHRHRNLAAAPWMDTQANDSNAY